ncbi:MAG: hypothetical protein QXI64_10640 [Sulfolobales archaeon]
MKRIRGIGEVVGAVLLIGVAMAAFLIFYPIAYNIIASGSTAQPPRASIADFAVLADRRTAVAYISAVGGSVRTTLVRVDAYVVCSTNVYRASYSINVDIDPGASKEFTAKLDFGSTINCAQPVIRVHTIFRMPDGSYVIT